MILYLQMLLHNYLTYLSLTTTLIKGLDSKTLLCLIDFSCFCSLVAGQREQEAQFTHERGSTVFSSGDQAKGGTRSGGRNKENPLVLVTCRNMSCRNFNT